MAQPPLNHKMLCESIIRLPPEVLTKVFSYLNTADKKRVASVSKIWREVLYSPCLWRGVCVTLPLYSPVGAKPMLASIVRRGINRIKVVDYTESKSRTLSLAEIMPYVKYLTLQNRIGVGTALQTLLAEPLPLLIHIDLFLKYDSELKIISEQCVNLEHLFLPEVLWNRFSITEFAKMFPNLKTLQLEKLSYCSGCDDDNALQLLSGQSADPAIVGCQKLEHLDLRLENITDQGIGYLKAGMPHLKSLSLTPYSMNYSLTDSGLQMLGNITTLEKLYLSYFGGFSDTGLLYLSRGAAKLVEISLYRCCNLTDRGIEFLASIKTLKSFILYNCPGISETSLLRLAQGAARLSHFEITDCSISDEGLGYMVRGPGLLSLKSWTLMHDASTCITSDCLLSTISALEHLELFNVDLCYGYTRQNLLSELKNIKPYLKVNLC